MIPNNLFHSPPLCVLQNKRHVKKHLFSDTDADYVTSEVSWLKESSRKPKPKVTKYSRPAAIKSKTVSSFSSTCIKTEFSLDNLYFDFYKQNSLPFLIVESPDLLPSSPKPRKKNVKSYKVRHYWLLLANNVLTLTLLIGCSNPVKPQCVIVV